MTRPSDITSIGANDLVDEAGSLSALLALNTAHEVELSPLTAPRLRQLVAAAFAAWRIGEAEAFLIAFDQNADYDSANFVWFRERYARFVYVDRVAVAAEARGRGHARRLYERLFDLAREAGHDIIVCEVNSSPPNPGSDAFHRALGFMEVGSGPVAGTAKTVRYLLRRLDAGERDGLR